MVPHPSPKEAPIPSIAQNCESINFLKEKARINFIRVHRRAD